MPAVGQSQRGAASADRQRRRRPRPRPVVHRQAAPPRQADQGDPQRATPAPRPTTPRQRSRPPAFRPVRSQAAPFKPQRTRARRATTQARSRLGDRRYNTRPAPPTPPFRINREQVGRAPAFRPISSQSRPLRVQQSQQSQKSRQALNRLPAHPAIPKVVGGLYLESDLAAIDDAYKKARLKAARATKPAQVREARRDYRRALRKLTHKTPEERIGAIRDAYKTAARSLGGESINDLYKYGNLSQRREMRKVGRTINDYEQSRAQEIAAERGIPVNQDVAKPAVQRVLGHNVKQASFGGDVLKVLAGAGNALDRATRIPNKGNASLADLANVPLQLTIASMEDPAAVGRSSLRTAIESVTSIPEGVKQLIADPKHSGHAMLEDYERRYGSIFNDPNEFRRRVQQESGLTPFVLDVASLGVPVGRAATLLARSGAAGRAVAALARVAGPDGKLRPLADFAETTHKAARAPRDARRLAGLEDRMKMAVRDGDTVEQARLKPLIKHARANVRSTERPALRFSGGEGGVRKQGSSPNLIIGFGQRGLDRTRGRATSAAAARAGLDESFGQRLVTVRGRKVVRMAGLRPGDREVVPKTSGVVGRSVRELPGLRRYTGRVARDLGEHQSISRIRLLTHRGRVINKIDKALKQLDDNEGSAMKYMLQLGATPDAHGVRILRERRAQIVAGRAAGGTRIAPLLEDTNDELKLIDRILADPASHLTPKSRAVADELRGIQLEEARRDPELTPEQEAIRRVTPQGKALGVDRGPDVEFFRGVLRDLEHKTEVPGLSNLTDELASMVPDQRGGRAGEFAKEGRKARKAAERDVVTAERRLAVAQERVREAERHGQPLETDEVRAARTELRKAKAARRALGKSLTRNERRSGLLLGRLSERHGRGAPVPTEDVRGARAAVSAAQKRVNALERKIGDTERAAGRAIGRAEGERIPPGRIRTELRELRRRLARSRSEKVKKGLNDRIARLEALQKAGGELRGPNERALGAELNAAELERSLAAARENLRDAQTTLAAAERDAPRLTRPQMNTLMTSELERGGRAGDLAIADRTVRAAAERLREELGNAPRVTEAQARRVVERDRDLAAAQHVRDEVRKVEKALRKVEKAAKAKRNMRLEEADEFVARVRQAADHAGLAEPAYWWSSLMPREMPSMAAVGKGLRAAHGNKPYKGTLFDIGAEEHSVDVFTRGVERNIKRRFQQALIVRNIETHAYEWSRGAHGGGLTIKELDRLMIDRAIDPKTVDLIEPRVLKRRAPELEGAERGDVLDEAAVAGKTEDDFVSTTQQDFAESRRRIEDVRKWDTKTQAQHRFLVVPRDVTETLDGVASKMDNTFWRGMEVVLKQKPARILLGAANVPWLAFQIASNAMLTGFGGGLNPWNIHGAHKWWKGLSADEREAVEAELGVTHGHHFGMDQPHLGATSSRMVNFWRAYKKSRVGRLVHKGNVMDLMFRVDETQNNFFRRILFYDRARKSAYRRMGHSWKSIDTVTTRLMDRVLARPPHQQLHLIAKHGAEFEEVAKHVNNFLGDYMRFTPAERFALQRNLMFYGYLRFSLRFTFYTMPVAHPIMANILGNVGRMGAQEIKELMGVDRNYSLPTSMLAQTYFGDRQDAKRNELRSLPLGRFNPFLNALTQLDGLQQAVGLVSPIYQILVDQAFEESSFTGRDWRIGGRPTPSESERPRNYYGSALSLLKPGSPRNRIAASELLGLAYPYRVATKTGIPGVVDPLAPNQSDDALLGSPRPMTYADPEAAKGVRKSRRDFEDKGAGKRLLSSLLPVFPERTSAPAVVSRELEREQAVRERNARPPGARKKRRRKKRTANRYGGGSSSGGRYR